MTTVRPMWYAGRTFSVRHAVVAGLVGASIALLASCESGTAPAKRSAPNEPSVERQTSAEDADPNAVVVVGTGIPAVDVPAVQTAVDRGGAVLLKGHFSFDEPPTKPLAPALFLAPPGLAYAPAAEVLVSKAVTISGTHEDGADMTTIEAGTIPFYVDAAGQRVTIRRLRFVRPISSAILVYAVRDLEIASSAIVGVVPFKNLSDGIGINTSGPPPTVAAPGTPANVSGTLNIVHNDIDMVGGTTADNTLGIVVFGVGTAEAAVEAHVAGNRIRNTTEPAINFRQIEGRAEVSHNAITTGPVAATATRIQVVRVASAGLYRIADNSIDCGWANPDAAAIGVFSNVAAWPVAHAVVEDNEINMSSPAATVFTAFSAGIGVFGFAEDNVVRHNTIRGSARAALSIPVFPLPPQVPATPQDNAFIENRFVDFTPAVADILVGPHALGTRVAGAGTVEDEGDGTIIVRTIARAVGGPGKHH